MIPEMQRVLDPGYLSEIAQAPIDQIRSMRAECTDLENGASYVRRLAQGRLDLLIEEAKRRAEGGGGNLGDLIGRLPDLLSDGVRAPGSGRVDQDLDPPESVVDPLTDVLDAVAGPAVVTSVPDIGDDKLSSLIDGLRHFEDQLSGARRSLHSAIDALNSELANRIAAGEPPVELG